MSSRRGGSAPARTAPEDAKISDLTLFLIAAATTEKVPSTLVWKSTSGWATESATPGFAARWTTASTPLAARRTAGPSSTLASMQRGPARVRHHDGRAPAERSSNTRTSWPRESRNSTTFEPTKPAPPVTRTRMVGWKFLLEATGRADGERSVQPGTVPDRAGAAD